MMRPDQAETERVAGLAMLLEQRGIAVESLRCRQLVGALTYLERMLEMVRTKRSTNEALVQDLYGGQEDQP